MIHNRFLFHHESAFEYDNPSGSRCELTSARYSPDASSRSWHSDCAPWHVEQMFIIPAAPSTPCAIANVRALRLSTSSWLCSAITPAPQQLARSISTSSMSSLGATAAIEPCSSGVKPRDTQPGQYATLMLKPPGLLLP